MKTFKIGEGAVVALTVLVLTACQSETKTTESEVTTSQESTVSAGTTETMVTDTATSTMAPADQVFATKAATGGLAEVELSQLAVSKAASADVKAFAQMLVTDHTAANQELTQIISAKGMTPPAALDAEHQQMREKLNGLSGAAFDKEYMAGMMKDHDATVADFRGESVAGGDPELKAFAGKTLPKLEEHAKKAHELAGKMGLH